MSLQRVLSGQFYTSKHKEEMLVGKISIRQTFNTGKFYDDSTFSDCLRCPERETEPFPRAAGPPALPMQLPSLSEMPQVAP